MIILMNDLLNVCRGYNLKINRQELVMIMRLMR